MPAKLWSARVLVTFSLIAVVGLFLLRSSVSVAGTEDLSLSLSFVPQDSVLAAATPLIIEPTTESPQSTDAAAPDIVGGQPATPGEYPWQARILVYGQHKCGGSLIDREWVLTAGHCLFDASKTRYPESAFTVVLGEHNVILPEGTEQELDVSEPILGPGFAWLETDTTRANNDVALLRLSSLANLNSRTAAIDLNTNPNISAGTIAWATGWGSTSGTGGSSTVLMEVDVPILTNSGCNRVLAE